MDSIYLLMIVALGVLAIADLIVGVSNDAVNFLNSAIGSKAVSFKTIMIVASLGIAIGAIFSSGMMEIARKGIFNPGMFMFSDVMIIFMAVMIADVLLLDIFNSMGMPTSTTVSIVFDLLGAAVAVALIKIGTSNGSFSSLGTYINTEKATQIISGIVLSVIIAFTVGAIVQFITRLFLSFNFEKKAKWVSALFGGIALTSFIYFILLKGIGGTNYASIQYEILGNKTIEAFIESHALFIIFINLLLWSLISYILIVPFKINIYKIIIIVGTFALALAFAGNDLVNFIGVPIAGYQSYIAWMHSGVPAQEFSMNILAAKVETPTLMLVASGLIMVLTLWFNKKARKVTETEINLSREGHGTELFQPHFLSRILVRGTLLFSKGTSKLIPNSLQQKMDKQFEKPIVKLINGKKHELPAFDLVRASINLMISSVLISIATSYKLPLSTTYVTFMVAMGSSLSDKAWGSESAVYRVAGVLNVIAGWFITAIIAFITAGVTAYFIYLGGAPIVAILLLIALGLVVRSHIRHFKKSRELKSVDSLNNAESKSLQGVIEESADNISKVLKRVGKINENTIVGLLNQDLALLKKSKNTVGKLEIEIDDLQNNIFFFIKNLDESSLHASTFYINVIGKLQDIAQSVGFISKVSHKHINNNHKALKQSQSTELKEIELKLSILFNKMRVVFDTRNFGEIKGLIEEKKLLLMEVSQCAQKQVARTRETESSPKNTTLYFSILLETEDLIKATMGLLELYAAKK